MKTDLLTSIGAAVIGVVIAFLACNALVPEISPVSFKKLDDADSNYELIEPDENVFNYRALNPTVEVYVGDCDEYDEYGNCVTADDENDGDDESEDEETTDETETPADETDLEREVEDLLNPTQEENGPEGENQNGSTN